VNFTDKSQVNALSVASREGHWQLLPSLVLAGANTSSKDKDGFTAVHWAAIEDEPLVMKCLLDLGLDSNTQDAKGWTPLMHACARGADEVVRVLVDWSVDIDSRNWDGDTALQITQRRRDPDEMVLVTKDILLDGVMASDEPAKGGSVQANGHMMVSVLEATDLYLEGKTGFVNTYVNLQLRMTSGARPQAAFTSCVLSNSCPEWHEVFRFDTTRMDKDAVLVAWVIAAPGEGPKEVTDGAHLGLTEEELAAISHMEAVTGKTLHEGDTQFTTAMQDSFLRLMRRADKAEDKEVLRLRKLAMAQLTGTEPTQDLKYSAAENKDPGGMHLTDRRWNEVQNLRAILQRSGCDVPEPLVPRSHVPLGCVVVRYRYLRAAVWGSEPVTVVRTLRLSCRGSLRVQIDFRPKFFCIKQEAVQMTQEEEEDIYGLRPANPEDEYREAMLEDEQLKRTEEARQVTVMVEQKAKKRAAQLSAEEALEHKNKLKHLGDPVALLKRFRQVNHWAGSVLKIRDDFSAQEAKYNKALKEGTKKGAKEDAAKKAAGEQRKKLSKRVVDYTVNRYKAWQAERAFKSAMLDKPIGTVVRDPLEQEAEKQQQASGAAPIPKKKIQIPWIPKLKAERWVEDYLEGSRLI